MISSISGYGAYSDWQSFSNARGSSKTLAEPAQLHTDGTQTKNQSQSALLREDGGVKLTISPEARAAQSAAADKALNMGQIHSEEDAKKAGLSEAQIKGLKQSGQVECEACANRKYQDGSDENVSFKSPAHVSPEAAGAAVRAHEGEHVANAYKKAEEGNGEVVQASVSIHTATCSECGRTYVSGGTTHTQIRYNSDPYAQNAKGMDAAGLSGASLDLAG